MPWIDDATDETDDDKETVDPDAAVRANDGVVVETNGKEEDGGDDIGAFVMVNNRCHNFFSPPVAQDDGMKIVSALVLARFFSTGLGGPIFVAKMLFAKSGPCQGVRDLFCEYGSVPPQPTHSIGKG